MKCDKCRRDLLEKEIQEHHIHPRFMDNPKGDGMKIDLCEKDHNIIHLLIGNIIWKYIPEARKSQCIEEVKQLGKKWGGING